MTEHPQVRAFREAASVLRQQRYWDRGIEDEIDFLRALQDVLVEVAYHLNATEVLGTNGLAAYAREEGILAAPFSAGPSTEVVLSTEMARAIERLIAAGTAARNTGARKGISD